MPTLNFLIEHQAQVVLATHIGRPKNKEPELSTQLLAPWFEQHGYTVRFVADFTTIAQTRIVPKEVIIIENLRFFPEEKNNDLFFAKQLATTAQYYVNDAFGVIHENDCSVTQLPYEFCEDKRSIGFLIEKELRALDKIKYNAQHPFVAILGGGKIEDKIPLISSLIDKIDTLLLCPAICFSFLKTLNQPIGRSLVAENMRKKCQEIMSHAESSQVKVIFPTDYQVAFNTLEGQLEIISADQFPDNTIGVSIGPKTVDQFIKEIRTAKIIFLNCAMGFADRPETQQSSRDIIDAIAQSSAYSVIAGGDSVDIALSTQHYTNIDHLSTGGGAALAYLSDALLPGLAAFEEQ